MRFYIYYESGKQAICESLELAVQEILEEHGEIESDHLPSSITVIDEHNNTIFGADGEPLEFGVEWTAKLVPLYSTSTPLYSTSTPLGDNHPEQPAVLRCAPE